jgi:hypothetical protein
MNKRKHLRRTVLAAVALAASGGSLVLGAGVAGASNAQVTAVGSDTTFDMMGQLFPSSVNNLSPIPLTGSNTATIASDPFTCAGGVTYTSSNLVPNGSGAGKAALFAEESAAANEQGCIDFARSSSPPEPHTLSVTYTTGDPVGSNFDYYAYALDGVAPLVGANSGSTVSAPITLGLYQMKYVYSCGGSSGATGAHTTWASASIGKSTDNIHRFWPQNGSGTLAVLRDALGFDPTVLSGVNHCTTLPIQGFSLGTNSTVNEENTEDGMVYANSLPTNTSANCDVSGTSSGYCNIADDFYIYSAGKLSQQWNDTTDYNSTAINNVASALGSTPTIGNLNTTLSMPAVKAAADTYVKYTAPTGTFNADTNRGTLAVDAAVVAEKNEWYSHLPAGNNPTDSTGLPGIRYVYNVADNQLPSYNGAKALFGFDNQTGGTKSALCHGEDSATITAAGFVPLAGVNAAAPAGSNLAGASCREFAGLSFPGQASPIHWAVTEAPVINTVSPRSGNIAGGTSVKITGTGLTTATSVQFGGTAATNVVANQDGSLTVTSPAGAADGPVDITVTNANGTSPTAVSDHFTYNG